MWRLIIWQRCVSNYTSNEKTIQYDFEKEVCFESEDIRDLFRVIESMSKVYASDVTRYEIRKVVD